MLKLTKPANAKGAAFFNRHGALLKPLIWGAFTTGGIDAFMTGGNLANYFSINLLHIFARFWAVTFGVIGGFGICLCLAWLLSTLLRIGFSNIQKNKDDDITNDTDNILNGFIFFLAVCIAGAMIFNGYNAADLVAESHGYVAKDLSGRETALISERDRQIAAANSAYDKDVAKQEDAFQLQENGVNAASQHSIAQIKAKGGGSVENANFAARQIKKAELMGAKLLGTVGAKKSDKLDKLAAARDLKIKEANDLYARELAKLEQKQAVERGKEYGSKRGIKSNLRWLSPVMILIMFVCMAVYTRILAKSYMRFEFAISEGLIEGSAFARVLASIGTVFNSWGVALAKKIEKLALETPGLDDQTGAETSKGLNAQTGAPMGAATVPPAAIVPPAAAAPVVVPLLQITPPSDPSPPVVPASPTPPPATPATSTGNMSENSDDDENNVQNWGVSTVETGVSTVEMSIQEQTDILSRVGVQNLNSLSIEFNTAKVVDKLSPEHMDYLLAYRSHMATLKHGKYRRAAADYVDTGDGPPTAQNKIVYNSAVCDALRILDTLFLEGLTIRKLKNKGYTICEIQK